MNQLVITGDGSHTIYVPGLKEHYHSVFGAVRESEHIFLGAGFNYCRADPLNIFEVGFGTGLNALLTAIRSMKGTRKVYYTSIEKYPLEEELIRSINHREFAGCEGESIANAISSAPWGEMTEICRNFSLKKTRADLLIDPIEGYYDLIYFDAFGPDKQPEMWSSDIFARISDSTVKGGVLVTYSCKGEVKRSLRSSGFNVNLLPGPAGKRHIIRAVKI
jgi:tRNA U34 5-methylaminomethyl-2-thiouridine-forming methyltransferase MnmC